MVASRDLAAGEQVAAQLSGAVAVALDVTDSASADTALAVVRQQLGGLDILVNNAGRLVEARAVDTTAAILREVFETNRAFRLDPALAHIKINSATPGYTATDMNRDAGVRGLFHACFSVNNCSCCCSTMDARFDNPCEAGSCLIQGKTDSLSDLGCWSESLWPSATLTAAVRSPFE